MSRRDQRSTTSKRIMNVSRNALSWMVVVMCVLCLMASVFIYVQHHILSTPTKHHFPRDTVLKCTSPADLKVRKAITPSMLRSGREDNATATTVDCPHHMVTNGSYSQPQPPQHAQVAPHNNIHETFRKIKSSGGRSRVGRADKPRDDGWFWSLLASPPPTDVPRVSPSMLKAQGQKVILLTYVRSGSSLTADIIDHSSDVYYVFEPLYKLADYAKHVKNWIQQFLDENERCLYVGQVILRHLLSCDVTQLVGALYENFLVRNKETSLMARCQKFARNYPFAAKSCLAAAESTCRSHDTILLKVVRLPVSGLQPLLTSYPELKIIYLVRDPRAALWSRINVLKQPQRDNFKNFARDLCLRMRDDALNALLMLNASSQRIRFLRYEDLAADPLPTSEHIYQFLNLTWTEHIQHLVLRQTNFSAGGAQRGSAPRRTLTPGKGGHLLPFTVVRASSEAAARAWRKTIPWDIVEGVQAVCDPVMSLLGYAPLWTLDEVRNETLPCMVNFKMLHSYRTLNPDLGRRDN